MIIASLLFYMFSIVTISSAVAVIFARNPVNSVLCLILTFFSTAGIFLLAGAEFIAMVLIIVYVGAVAVLFLFIVMMLNINIAKSKEAFLKYAYLAIPIVLILLGDFYILFESSIKANISGIMIDSPIDKSITNTHAIGNILYTKYGFNVQIAGLILLVAMISSISLTLRSRINVKKQDLSKQLDRNKDNSIEIIRYIKGEKSNAN